MPKTILRTGVVARRFAPVTKWGAGELRPVAILPQEPDTAPRTRLPDRDGAETWYLGGRDVTLHSGDTGHLRDNLASGRPSLWVALKGRDPASAEVVCVTADPYEGEGLASDEALTVEALPMPGAMQAVIAEFVEAHHVEIAFKKRKRHDVDPNAPDPRAARVLSVEEKWDRSGGRAGRRKGEDNGAG